MIDLAAGKYRIAVTQGAKLATEIGDHPMLGIGISLTRGAAALFGRGYFDFMTGVMPPGVDFSRAGSATYFDAAGVLQTAAADQPRFDHDPVTKAPNGLLIEGSRTNVLLRSEEFNDASWGKVAGSVTDNATTAPTGAATADQFTENTTTTQHDVRVMPSFVSGTTYTFSVFAKGNGRRLTVLFPISTAGHGATFDLVNGTVASVFPSITAAIVPVGGGWYRCSVTATASATAPATIRFVTDNGTSGSFTGDGVSGFYLFGAQLEVGAFPSSYIPTTTAAETRAADQPRITANLGTRDVRVTTEAGVQVLTAQALTGSYWPALTGPQRIRKIEVL